MCPCVAALLLYLQVLAIIFIGCVLQFVYLFRVLLLGATYNKLQAKHLSILVATQVSVHAHAHTHMHTQGVSLPACTVLCGCVVGCQQMVHGMRCVLLLVSIARSLGRTVCPGRCPDVYTVCYNPRPLQVELVSAAHDAHSRGSSSPGAGAGAGMRPAPCSHAAGPVPAGTQAGPAATASHTGAWTTGCSTAHAMPDAQPSSSCSMGSSTASERRAAVEALAYVKKNLRHNDEFFGLFGMTLDMGIVTRIVGLGATLLISLGSLLASYVYSRFTRT